MEKLEAVTNLDKRLERISSHDWSGKSADHIWYAVKRYLGHIPIFRSIADQFGLDQLRLYRCRLNIDTDKENMDVWSTYGAPPPAFCGENGRANIVRFPVFYCSDNAATALAEVRPNLGDQVFMSEWLPRCGRMTQRVILFPQEIPDGNPWHRIARTLHANTAQGTSGGFNSAAAEKILRVNDFLSAAFVAEPLPYYLSSAIAHRILFSGGHGTDYIVYPSAQTQHRSGNLALHPNFAAAHVYLRRVLHFEVTEMTEEGAIVNHIRTGRVVENAIVWMGPMDDDWDIYGDNLMRC